MIRILTAVAAFLLSACDKSAPDESAFAGVLWHVSLIDGTAPAGPATLLFDGKGNVSGRAPCNSWGANYELRGERLTLTNIFSTKMACDALADEERFFEALTASEKIAVADGALVLSEGGRSRIAARQ
jgi:heat shock protein HslJ